MDYIFPQKTWIVERKKPFLLADSEPQDSLSLLCSSHNGRPCLVPFLLGHVPGQVYNQGREICSLYLEWGLGSRAIFSFPTSVTLRSGSYWMIYYGEKNPVGAWYDQWECPLICILRENHFHRESSKSQGILFPHVSHRRWGSISGRRMANGAVFEKRKSVL